MKFSLLSLLCTLGATSCVAESNSNALFTNTTREKNYLFGKRVKVIYLAKNGVLDNKDDSFNWPTPLDIDLINKTVSKLQEEGAHISPLPSTIESLDFAINSIQQEVDRKTWDYLMMTDIAFYKSIKPENRGNTLVSYYNGKSIRFETLRPYRFSNISSTKGLEFKFPDP
jgi:hypothetical protein